MSNLLATFPIAKSDPVRRELHVDLYKADVLDSHNEYMTAATVRKMVHELDLNAVGIDREHDQRPLHATHARLVEKSFDEQRGAARVVIQFSPQAWNGVVEPGVFKGVSIFGVGERRPGVIKSADGKEHKATEILRPALSLISLTAKPANRTQDPQFLAKSNFAEPGTPGEESADSAKNEAQRARVKQQRAWERRVEELKSERTRIEYGSGDPVNKRRVIGELTIEIAALEQAIIDLDGGEVKKADALDLLPHGRATGFDFRGGTSQTVEFGPLPSEISKDDQNFWADLASEALGVRSPKGSVKKSDDDELLSNSLGLRNTRM